MKALPVILTVSLTANLAAIGYFSLRPQVTPPAITSRPTPVAAAMPDAGEQIRAALTRGDLAALTAAGVPLSATRDLLLGRALSRYAERTQRQADSEADQRWWRTRATAVRSESSLLAQRELNDAVRAALGTDLFSNGSDAGLTSFLPPAKRDALRRIQQDYDEMMAKFSPNGIQLASDKERSEEHTSELQSH